MQRAYAEMLRDHVGPGIRELGFKGSKGNYSLSKGPYVAGVGFQKSVYLTKGEVMFRASTSSVTHRDGSDLYWDAVHSGFLKQCGPPEEVRVRTDDIFWSSTLERQDSQGSYDWYRVRPETDIAALAAQVLGDLQSTALPVMLPRMDRPFDLPGYSVESRDGVLLFPAE
jgi:hypothetical protein